MTNSNFTEFLKQHPKCLVVSDLEGLAPVAQIERIEDAVKAGNNGGVIYLGDLLDYTTVFGLDEKIIKKDNLCQFKLLKLFTDNPDHCRCILGNRDLNKIKLWPLLQLNSGKKWWKHHKSDILKIAKQNIINNDINQLWNIEDLTPFCPYWRDNQSWKDKQKTHDNDNKNLTISKPDYLNHALYDRYVSIFGIDNSTQKLELQGTMSAQNTLKYLLIELLDNEEYLKIKEDKDLCAKVVFTVYARMLDPELAENPEIPEIDGLLYKYYKQALCIGYATNNNNLYLFSHGGITENFINHSAHSYDILKQMGDNLRQICQEGGGQNEDLFNQFVDFNKYVSTSIDSILHNTTQNDDKLPDLDLSVLIALSVPAENNKKIKEQTVYSTALSPIQVSAPTNSKLDRSGFFDKYYNFFGHIPKGFGYSFGKAANTERTYYVSTDFSNAILKSSLLKPETYDYNYIVLLLNINTNEMMLEGDIKLDLSKFNKETFILPKDIQPPELDLLYSKGTLTSEDTLSIKFLETKLELSDIIIKNTNGNDLFYNGIGTVNGTSFYIFTKTGTNFKKALILMPMNIAIVGGFRKQILNARKHGGNRKSKNTRKHTRTRKHIKKQKNTRKH